MDKSALGRLSPELRNRIYELVFGPPGYYPNIVRLGHREYNGCIQHAFTRVCHQARAESLLMYYANTPFYPRHRSKPTRAKLCAWLRCIGPDACAALRSVGGTIMSAEKFGAIAPSYMEYGLRVEVSDVLDKVPEAGDGQLWEYRDVVKTLLEVGVHVRRVELDRSLTTSPTTTNQEQVYDMDNSPLNRLSQKLRNRIYGFVFSAPRKVKCLDTDVIGNIQHPVTRIGRQLRSETLLMDYASTDYGESRTWYRDSDANNDGQQLSAWLNRIGPEACRNIRSLGVFFSPELFEEFVDKFRSRGYDVKVIDGLTETGRSNIGEWYRPVIATLDKMGFQMRSVEGTASVYGMPCLMYGYEFAPRV
ncbi:hypothetical protein LTR36_001993 [Oleoguttula mirabilis]|uniref:Uncharacterized protein n=1 Tax=Oleoguttula mirabilis TaxID=1507867 RepID=A0AAV9JLE2_9PEZI|nr:hypothetical protein LTR36_001993 [Oleoguttula mirabilis]